jgi:hypothetical protein
MIHEGFAQLGQFMRNSEEYTFDAQFHVNTEQILVGQEASIMIRPNLKVNGRKSDLNLIKNCKVKLTINDYMTGQQISREYTDLKLSNDQETIITF